MPVLGKFTKQSSEALDVDVTFGKWLFAAGDDSAASLNVQAEPGITLGTSHLDPDTGTVKVWVSGGLDGEQYKITVTLTTTAGRVKQIEVVCKIKDS